MKKAPPSPKLQRLDADIKAERDPAKGRCLRAERAGLIGRLGFFEEARAEIDALQKELARQPDAAVSIWVQIAKGWIEFYAEDFSSSRDHFLRAFALSSSLDFPKLRVLSAAWLASLHYRRDEFELVGEYLAVALPAELDDHLTRTRLCLVVAMAYFFADRYDLAQPWFARARNHAVKSSDEAALSSLNYNIAIRRTFYLTVASIDNIDCSSANALAKIGIESTHSFDRMLGISFVGDWVYPMEAMFNSACNKFERAIEIYDGFLDSSLPKALEHCRPIYLADLAWCCAKVSLLQRAIQLVSKVESYDLGSMYVEDQVIAFGRLRQTQYILGNMDSYRLYAELERSSRIRLQALRECVLKVFDRVL